MDVNLNLYKTFIMVAKTKDMTKAAEKLLISQPAVSKAIKSLEAQLNMTLFNRSTKGLELTEEGKMLFERVSVALSLIENAEVEISSFKKLEKGEVKIGISSVLSKCLLMDILKNFREEYPNVKISITNGVTKTLINKLNEGELDFVIYNESKEEYDVTKKEIKKMRYVFCYNPLSYEVSEIKDIKDLNNYSLILQKKGSNTRDLLDSKTKNILNPQIEVMSQDLICNLVENGLGIGFVFEDLMKGTNLKKIDNLDLGEVNIYLATNKSIKPSFAAETFIKSLK